MNRRRINSRTIRTDFPPTFFKYLIHNKPMKLIFMFALLSSYVFAAGNSLELCLKDSKDCGSVESENPQAEVAFTKGCDAKDFYACYRLGQFYQFAKKPDVANALKYYEMACAGKDKYGCEGSYALTMELCYDKKQKKYCGIKEPQGEYRIMAFFEKFDPKYKDAFVNHDFSYALDNKKLKAQYEKLVKKKNKKLLEALLYAKEHGHHDGADAESLHDDIDRMQGKKR